MDKKIWIRGDKNDIPYKQGIYFLYKYSIKHAGVCKLVYIGKAKNLHTRINSHVREWERGLINIERRQALVLFDSVKPFDVVEYFLIDRKDELDTREYQLINEYNPQFNNQTINLKQFNSLDEAIEKIEFEVFENE